MKRSILLDTHIVDIVENNKVSEQKELQSILRDLGHDLPQASLSRRLKKLKISKVDGLYKVIDFLQHNIPLVLSLRVSDLGMIVMHTQPGQASSLAYFLDQKYIKRSQSTLSSILGTIAGDDTVLIIIKSKAMLNEALSMFYQDFPYLRKQ